MRVFHSASRIDQAARSWEAIGREGLDESVRVPRLMTLLNRQTRKEPACADVGVLAYFQQIAAMLRNRPRDLCQQPDRIGAVKLEDRDHPGNQSLPASSLRKEKRLVSKRPISIEVRGRFRSLE